MIQLAHFVAQHPHGASLRARRAHRMGAIHADKALAIRYAGVLVHDVVGLCRAAGETAVRNLRPHWPAAHDARPPTIKHEVNRLRGHVEPEVRQRAPRIASRAITAQAASTDAKLAGRIKMAMGVEVRTAFLLDQSAIHTEMRDSLAENIELITSISADYFDELETVLGDNWENVGDWGEAVADVMHLGDVTQSRAELIARDQTLKMNSRFNQARQESLGVTRYIWTTVGDDRVREAHQDLEGTEHEWDDPPTDADGNTGHPGDCGVNCRCAADPVLDLGDEDADERDRDEDESDLDESEDE